MTLTLTTLTQNLAALAVSANILGIKHHNYPRKRRWQGQGQGKRERQEDEKINPYITAIRGVWHRFTIDINRIELNNI